jgi:hypothetical protein
MQFHNLNIKNAGIAQKHAKKWTDMNNVFQFTLELQFGFFTEGRFVMLYVILQHLTTLIYKKYGLYFKNMKEML